MLGKLLDLPDEKGSPLEVLLMKLRYKEGKIVYAPSNKPLLLNDPNFVWFVSAGSVNVFVVPVDGNEIAGARTHLFRTEGSTVLIGLQPDEVPLNATATFRVAARDTKFALMVIGSGDSELLRLPRTRFLELANSDEYRAQIAGLVDQWIRYLYIGVVKSGALPKQYTQLELGNVAALKLDMVARPKKGVAWLKPIIGEVRFLGRTDLLTLKNDRYVPISDTVWVKAANTCKIDVLSTVEMLKQDPDFRYLSNFHEFIQHMIALNAETVVTAEKRRLNDRARSDTMKVEMALTQLASPLIDSPAEALIGVDTEDPLLAACQLVGQALGIKVRAHPDMLRGKKLLNPLGDIAKASRFRTRDIALKGNWWQTDNGPILGYLEEGKQPVALLPLTPSSYEMFNPVTRTRTPVDAILADKLSYFGQMFYRPFPDTKLTGWQVLRFGARGIERDLLTMLAMGFLGGLVATVTPLMTGIIFDNLIPSSDRGQLLQIGVVVLFSFMAAAAFQITRSIALLRLQGRMDGVIQAALWDRLINLPTPFFRNYSAGDLSSRAIGLEAFKDVLAGPTTSSIISGIFSIFNFALLFAFDSSLALLAVVLVFVAAAVTMAVGLVRVRYQRKITDLQGKISGLILQIVTGITKFRLAGAENRAFTLWARTFSQQKQLSVRARMASNYLVVFNSMFPVFAAMLLFAAVNGSQTLGSSTGSFLAFYAAFTMFMASALELSIAVVTIYTLMPFYERAKPIFQTLPEVDDSKSDPGELTGHIEVGHVSFRYKADGPLVLRDVSFEVNRGEFVALVGGSGSGKSTLFRMLLGFETPESGAIFYDGQDMSGLDLRAVRRQLGVVLQNSQLMSGSIFSNIVGQTGFTVDDAWEAARMAGLDQDIKAMAMGMHTVVGEGGSTFSGGQRQRLLIARAIVTKPRIMFFDEATSALDNKTQAVVSQSLEKLDATRIVIAHRLSTIINADRIIVLERGQVQEMGTYRELMNQKGLFAELAKRQLA
jgi:NHLM bacteriocin system ABC transporter ATP-binding protein